MKEGLLSPVWHNAFADVSISEEPGAVVPHAGIRAGSVGQLAGLPRWRQKEKKTGDVQHRTKYYKYNRKKEL